MYSPQIHLDIARHRQADMLREAHRERLASLAAAGEPHRPGKLARIGVLSGLAWSLRLRAAGRRPATDPAA